MSAILFHHMFEFRRSVLVIESTWGHRYNPEQPDHCQHHWTTLFRLHPRLGNHQVNMGKVWQDGSSI